jgi:hypothetical protein
LRILCKIDDLMMMMTTMQVEVRIREAEALNIHMFCAHHLGPILSTMCALNGFSLGVLQVVISLLQ